MVVDYRKAGVYLLAIPAPFEVLHLHRGQAVVTTFISHRSL